VTQAPLPIWFERTLTLLPLGIALLWIAGIARFRHYELSTPQWLVLVAAAFALHVVVRRLSPVRPLPPLPAGAKPNTLAALAATLWALVAAALGGLLEFVVTPARPSSVPWPVRGLWHAGCTFGVTYCGFLLRLHQALARPTSSARAGKSR
jgi:hypothetical protein